MKTYVIRNIKGRRIIIIFFINARIFEVHYCRNEYYFIRLKKVVSFLRHHGVEKEKINEFLFVIKEEFINNKNPKVKEALDALDF